MFSSIALMWSLANHASATLKLSDPCMWTIMANIFTFKWREKNRKEKITCKKKNNENSDIKSEFIQSDFYCLIRQAHSIRSTMQANCAAATLTMAQKHTPAPASASHSWISFKSIAHNDGNYTLQINTIILSNCYLKNLIQFIAQVQIQ